MLKRLAKKFIYSDAAPSLLVAKYFSAKEKKSRKRLKDLRDTSKHLLTDMEADQQAYWQERIDLVNSSPDNANIPRSAKAGEVNDEYLIMHNGIKIDPLGYYGLGLTQMLVDNKGVHEPQEEFIFQEVLSTMTNKKPVMLELGSYWAFYSMWLLQQFPLGKCWMVEPDKHNLYFGKRNFLKNELKGKFIHAGIGDREVPENRITTVDSICDSQGIDFIDILHSDIQGFELEMLNGSTGMLDKKAIGYVFISTHSNDLHADCRAFLRKYDFEEVASANLDESYSWDGILAMRARDYPGVAKVEISKRGNQ